MLEGTEGETDQSQGNQRGVRLVMQARPQSPGLGWSWEAFSDV